MRNARGGPLSCQLRATSTPVRLPVATAADGSADLDSACPGMRIGELQVSHLVVRRQRKCRSRVVGLGSLPPAGGRMPAPLLYAICPSLRPTCVTMANALPEQ